MMKRILDSLRRHSFEQLPESHRRPNELNRDVARAERLRREARQANAARAAQPAAGEERAPRPRDQASAAPPPSERRLSTALRSRAGLREAWLAKEVLGPPAALRGAHGHLARPSIHASPLMTRERHAPNAAFVELANRFSSAPPSASGVIAGPRDERD